MSARRTGTKTKADAGNNGILGMLLFSALAAASGGAPAAILAAGAGGYATGAGATDQVNLDRLRGVLDQFYGGASIEALPVPFATMYERLPSRSGSAGSAGMTDARAGNLARAVSASIANPFIFRRLDSREAGVVDPGLDRAAMIPVDDACRMFPRSRLIAINATGKPIFYSSSMTCALIEVPVPSVRANPQRVFLAQEPDFSAVVGAGHEATRAALEAAK